MNLGVGSLLVAVPLPPQLDNRSYATELLSQALGGTTLALPVCRQKTFVSTPSKIELDIFNTALTRALNLKMLNFDL